MKVSIITATYNSEKTVRDTIECILNQTYKDIEYIIIDGDSKDNTLNIVKSYEGKIDKIISEPDKGIYDAMNKGIQQATGDIIGILNSDDFYASNSVLEEVVQTLKETNADTLYGDLVYVNPENTNKIIRNWKAGSFLKQRFIKGWMPPHPTFFVRKNIYAQFGTFDISFGISADYELMLRFLYKNNISTTYLPKMLVKMRAGGESNFSLQNRLRANKEDRKAWKRNGLKPKFYTIWMKPIRKIGQFFNKK